MRSLSSLKLTSCIPVIQISMGVCALFAASQISIPLPFIPITLQTVAVMLIGMTYSPTAAFQTLAAWLGLAALGAPVLSNFSGGLTVLFGPRGGYLAGMCVVAPLLSLMRQYISQQVYTSWMRFVWLLCAGAASHAIIFLFGIGRLAMFVGWAQAIHHGFWPFVLPGLVKVILFMGCLRTIQNSFTEGDG